MTSTKDLAPPISVVYMDLDKPSEAGSTFLVIDSMVETDVKTNGPSVEYKLDLGRPDGKGESRCKLFKGRSSARWNFTLLKCFPLTPCSRYYTGFSPIFSRYNGENGLVGAINVWECRSKDGLEEYLRGAGTCSRVVPQCQVGLFECSSNNYFDHLLSPPQRLLFSWGPGSAGERLAQGSGVKVERGHYLMLQVRLSRSYETINTSKPGGVQSWDRLPH